MDVSGFTGFDIAIVVLVALVLILLFKGIRTVPQGYNHTVERFGRYTKTLTPGLNIINPIFERIGAKLPEEVKIAYIRVWETPECATTYREVISDQ